MCIYIYPFFFAWEIRSQLVLLNMAFRGYYGRDHGHRDNPRTAHADGDQPLRYLTIHQVKALNAIKRANPSVIRRQLYPEPSSESVANSSIYVPSVCTVSVRKYQRLMLELRAHGYTNEATVPILKVDEQHPPAAEAPDDNIPTAPPRSALPATGNSGTGSDEDSDESSTSSTPSSAKVSAISSHKDISSGGSSTGSENSSSTDDSDDDKEPTRNSNRFLYVF